MAKTSTKMGPQDGRYTEGVGRRKTATARVRIVKGKGVITVNGKTLAQYFSLPSLQEKAQSPLTEGKPPEGFDASVLVGGGGIHSQAEAVRHGLSRAIVEVFPDMKKRLRALGFLTRDSRMVERKKYGFKKARRAPQWKKR